MPEFDGPDSPKAPRQHPAALITRGAGVGDPSMPSPLQTFAGLDFNTWGAGWPPDTVGDVGPNNYVQAVNTSVGIYSKTGAQQAAFTFNSLWSGAGSGTPCDTTHNGDPTVVYDPAADRWFVADFAWTNLMSGPYYECIAVSKTGNPVTDGWWLYAVRADDAGHPYLADYPKMGIWPDGLYMTANMFDCLNASCSSATYKNVRVWALNRTQMEAGAAVQVIIVDTTSSYFSLLPSNLRGSAPPAGTPNYLVAEDLIAYKFDVWKFHVDWAVPSNSTFTGPRQVSQTNYTLASGAFIPQPGTTTKIDSLEDRMMMQAQYRNLSGTESLWVSHTVGNAPAGVQWAQINVTGGTVSTTPVQQQIFGNLGSDGVHRWMPSLAVDQAGNMAVGYSASSSGVFPSIRYAGRLATDPVNTLAQGEATMYAGTGSQTVNTRWGDYSAMSVDPTDDCTFWYTNEYYAANGGDWQTRIGSFKFSQCGSATGADLSITKTDSPDPVVADSPLTYTLTASNTGPSNASNVTVTDTLPANVIFGSATPSQGSCSGTTGVTCNLGTINNGASATIIIAITPVQPGTITNTASVTATESDPNTLNNSASQPTSVNAQKKTKYLTLTDGGFSSATLSAAQGTTVQWNLFGPSSNDVSDDTGMGLFSSGPQTPVSFFGFKYIAAGQYAVMDGLGHSQTVKVALNASPTSGTTSTAFTITWSSANAPAGFAFDIQIRRPAGAWVDWMTGQTGKSALFTPDAGVGTYQFRGRMRNTGSSAASAYSAAKKITVS